MINDETDEQGMYDYLATHALISDHAADAIRNHCDFSPNATEQSSLCDNAVDEAGKDLYYINIYNIYAPNCASSILTAKPKTASVSVCVYIYVCVST